MKELKYIAKNNKGFSLEDIKIKELTNLSKNFYFYGTKKKRYVIEIKKTNINWNKYTFSLYEWESKKGPLLSKFTKTFKELKEGIIEILKDFWFKEKEEINNVKKLDLEINNLEEEFPNQNKPPFKIEMVKKELPFKVEEPIFITRGFDIRELIDNWNEEELYKKFDFDVYLPSKKKNLQRPLVWTLEQKQSFILYLIKNEKFNPPIAVIAKREREEMTTHYEVIDWKQRLSTLISFYKNEFPIEINWYKYYRKDLSQDILRKYLDWIYILGYIVYEDYWVNHEKRTITDDEKIEWFKQLNFLGTPQDIKHLQSLEK